jgi:hypothetical protein
MPDPTTMADSRTKVEAALRHAAQEAGGDTMGAAAAAMLPMALSRLPEDPEVLDEVLLRYAALLLDLRSDTAAALCIALAPEDDVAA